MCRETAQQLYYKQQDEHKAPIQKFDLTLF